MSQIYATIALGRIGNNTQALGALVAFLVTNDLLNQQLVQDYPSAVGRIKMQDLAGAAFLTTVLGGELRSEHLSEAGRTFCEAYFGSETEQQIHALAAENEEEDWRFYDAVSPVLTTLFRGKASPPSSFKKRVAKILKFPSRSS
ncbi:MAG: hypothetical protein K0U55_10900 [Gammaproteobacteria bacterium]|jgi:hypothetical protein|nr:hypothetical protein [Gammaproteobacteria bacterium]